MSGHVLGAHVSIAGGLHRAFDRGLEATCDAFNASTQMMYSSDWPHWDFDAPSVIFDLPFLDEQAKRNILGLTAKRVFRIED